MLYIMVYYISPHKQEVCDFNLLQKNWDMLLDRSIALVIPNLLLFFPNIKLQMDAKFYIMGKKTHCLTVRLKYVAIAEIP